MTSEAASLALAVERRDLDLEEQQDIEDAWDNEPFEPYDDVEDES